jgi:lysophospholipase L1-like esterase
VSSIHQLGPDGSGARVSQGRKTLFVLTALFPSFMIALLLGEVMVRVAAPQNLSGTWREYHARGYMVNKAGGTARHQFGDRLVHYRFNDLHMRGAPIGSGKVRVLALGDSYTFGWLLNEADTYLAKLQGHADERFRAGQFEILNGAAGGWGTEDYVAFLEDHGESIKPEIVLAFLGIDDTRRSINGRIYRVADPAALRLEATGYKRSDATLKRLVNAIPRYEVLLEHSHLVQLMRKVSLRGQAGALPAPTGTGPGANSTALPAIAASDPAIVKQKALFIRLADWCDKHNAKLLVTTNWPVDPNHSPTVENNQNRAFRAQAAEFFRDRGIDFFDAGPPIGAQIGNQLDKYLIKDDGHPTEAGAQLVADVIWPWLETRLRFHLYARTDRPAQISENLRDLTSVYRTKQSQSDRLTGLISHKAT